MASALDKLTAAKNSLAGDQVNLTVCKATNHDVLSPKRKHVEVLLTWSNNPNLSIPDLADRLFARVADANWTVVFKAMIVCHELMAKGGERFIQNLASRSNNFNVTTFLDKGNIVGYDMSPFIRRYGHYLNERSLAYRQMGYDFCRLKKGETGTELRTMDYAKLMKTIPVMQKLLDSLVDFQVQQGELGNSVINSAFILMFKDLVKLFACYNDGVINLLEKFFDLKKPQAKESLDLYKKFLIRMDTVSEFLKVAENLGVHRDELPDLSKAPSSLLTALENHVQTMDKKSTSQSPARPVASGLSNVKVGSLVLPASTAAALGMSQDSGTPPTQVSPSLPPPGQGSNQQALADKKRHLEAEKERLMALKQRQGSAANSTVASPSASLQQIATTAAPAGNPMDDFAGLSLGGAAPAPAMGYSSGVMHGGVDDLYAQPVRGNAMGQPQAYAPMAASTNPFGGAGNDLFASSQAPPIAAAAPGTSSAPLGMGELLMPQVMGEFATKEAPKPAGLGKDVDSSLNIVAQQGLTLNGQMPRKHQQFQPQPSAARTGGSTWSPMQQSSTVAPTPQMGAGWTGASAMPVAAAPMYGGVQPIGGGMGMQQPMMMGGAMGMALAQQRPVYGASIPMQQQPMGAMGMQQPAGFGQPQDPFGPVPGAQSHF